MTFLEALNAAKDTTNPDDYISRVKRVVQEELLALDSTSTVESTPYFNHTAVPDFIVSWHGEAGKKSAPKREIFLRHSYQSIVDDSDEHYLGQSDAIVMSLRASDEPEQDHPEVATVHSPIAPRLLVTDAAAIQVVAGQEAGAEPGPLNELVRANFIRGAKGRIDPQAAARLVQLDQPRVDMSAASATHVITASFMEDAAARINRTAQLIDLALAPHTGGQTDLVGGRLSRAELRYLLPWLLSREPHTIRPDFWVYIGTLFDFKELESIREDLIELDLTPLVQANAHRWSARRAYVGLVVDANANDDPQELEPKPWGFRPGSLSALSVDLDGRRLFLAQGGTLLKSRPSTSSAVWERIRETVDGMRLRRVNLRGIRRSVSINAEQSPDIQSDVEEVTHSLDDNYFVDEVTLRFLAPGDREGTVDLDVQFGENLVVAQADASIADLTRSALGVLDYRNPASSDEIGRLLGEQPSENEDS